MNKKNAVLYIMITVFFYLLSRENYLLFHVIVEFFAVFIGMGMFIFALNRFKTDDNCNDNFFIFIGIMFGGISLIDFMHTLSYKGMNIIAGVNSNYATQLWIIGRMFEAIIILTAVILCRKIRKIKVFGLIFFNILVILISISVVFYFQIFPDCYIDGKGLTSFKKNSEYIIMAILIAALIIFSKKREVFNKENFENFQIAIIFTIISEFMFTLYFDVYGIANMLGHILKLFAFIFIYKSVLKNLLVSPYEKINVELKRLNELMEKELVEVKANYEEIVENAEDLITIIDNEGIIVYINPKSKEFLEESSEKCIGKSLTEFISSEDLEKTKEEIIRWKIDSFEKTYFENKTKSGMYVSWIIKKIKRDDKKENIFFIIGRNITDTKKYQEELKRQKMLMEEASNANNVIKLR